jgi:ribose 5-phosphate isomerase A
MMIMNSKERAARKALELVESNTAIGLGTGSTTRIFIDLLGEQIKRGALTNIKAVPTSDHTAQQANKWGIALTTLAETSSLSIAVDGADEVDPDLNMIKGLGRALLREKVVEIHTDRLIIIVDESKLVSRLGAKGALPVEILPFEAEAHVQWLHSLGCQAELWLEEDGSRVVTDNGNYLALCWFEDGIEDVYSVADRLAYRPGIIEHGLFIEMAHQVIVASEQDTRILTRKPR